MIDVFVQITFLQGLRGGDHRHLADECLYCYIEAVSIDFEDGEDEMSYSCISYVNEDTDPIPDMPYEIDLPADFIAAHETALSSGSATVCIPGGQAVRSYYGGDHIVIPENAQLQILLGGTVDINAEPAFGVGGRTVLVVRVSGTFEAPDESAQQIAGATFGIGSNPFSNSMVAQYQRCSFNKLSLVPASGNEAISDGVVDVQLGYSLQGVNVFNVLRDAQLSLVTSLALSGSLTETYDNVMFCLGKGTAKGNSPHAEKWTAFAHVHGWMSVYNSGRCDKLSALMHEMGHNIGLVHSSEGSLQYGDTTGVVSPEYVCHLFLCK